MATRAKYAGGQQQFFDDQQQFELLHVMAPIQYRDDFVGAGSLVIPAAGSAESGVDWVKKIVGAAPPTVAGVASGAGGQIACTLTATSEKQDAAIYHGDQKSFDVTKGLIIEWRAQLSVLPSAAGVQAVFGVSGVWIDGPDNAAQYLEFGATANGAILVRSQDGTTQKSIASGVTVLTTEWHVYRIDATDVTDIKYFIDGVQVSANNAVPFVATGANAVLQPYAAMYKPSGVGVGTLLVDDFKAWAKRI